MLRKEPARAGMGYAPDVVPMPPKKNHEKNKKVKEGCPKCLSNPEPTTAGNEMAGSIRPKDTPICDFYTTDIFKNNSDANQQKLLVKLVNTVVIGAYTPGKGQEGLNGILAPGTFNGIPVNIAGFFDGTMGKTTNFNGVATAGVNFLDDGGAEPLKQDKPANGNSSKQFFLLTHLYKFFGGALGCSKQSGPAFGLYDGKVSMLSVHKFMNLDINQLGFFTQQLGLSAKSFGVSNADIQIIADLMNTVFNVQCGKATSPFLPLYGGQFFCLAKDCPQAKDVDAQCQSDIHYGKIPMQDSLVGQSNNSTGDVNYNIARIFKCMPRKK